MKISEIYNKYKIPPSLQIHQLRVAAVGKMIAENIDSNIDVNSIVTALIIHDMGNIVKFNLEIFPEFFKPEGVDYWKEVQEEFIAKYGNLEHDVTNKIVKEIGVNSRVLELIESIDFTYAVNNLNSNDLEKMICNYSDQRVLPTKVGSLDERLDEGHKRWLMRSSKEELEIFINMSNALKQMEKIIFDKLKINPADINDETVKSIIEELKNYEI